MTEQEYIDATNLAKLRTAEYALRALDPTEKEAREAQRAMLKILFSEIERLEAAVNKATKA